MRKIKEVLRLKYDCGRLPMRKIKEVLRLKYDCV